MVLTHGYIKILYWMDDISGEVKYKPNNKTKYLNFNIML